jgi:hypothetical protein
MGGDYDWLIGEGDHVRIIFVSGERRDTRQADVLAP